MDWKLGGLVALLVAGNAAAEDGCDWRVASDKRDSMTDQRVCLIMSSSAKIGVEVRGPEVTFVSTSSYHHGLSRLALRIDDNPAISLGRNVSTGSFGKEALTALDQIKAGKRLRTRFLDYPATQEGDAPICTLPQLIANCR